MRYRHHIKPTVRTITAKFAGNCYGCGAEIAAGVLCDYWPGKGIGHLGAFGGDGDKMGQCYSAVKNQGAIASFIDIDRQYEDSCADICGR